MTRHDLLAEEHKDRLENIVDGRFQRAVAIFFAFAAFGFLIWGLMTGKYPMMIFFVTTLAICAWVFKTWARHTWRRERYRPQWPRRFPLF